MSILSPAINPKQIETDLLKLPTDPRKVLFSDLHSDLPNCPQIDLQKPTEVPPENTIFITNELTVPFSNEIVQEFFPPGSFLRENKYTIFHKTLSRFGRGDLSFKLDSCTTSGMRLDCEEMPWHDGFIPLRCNRRICPECSRFEMNSKINKYIKLPEAVPEYKNYKYRFWTFTIIAKKNQPLKQAIKAVSKAIHYYWLNVYGQKSKKRGGPHQKAGGIFCIEVGEGWNVHVHALIYGPYHTNLKTLRLIWEKGIKKNWLGGHRIHVRPIDNIDSCIRELISYPLNPDKRIGLDENLLAHIELGFSGKNKSEYSPGIKGYRRYVEKGTFYNLIEKPHHNKQFCPFCAEKGFYREMAHEKCWDDHKGKWIREDHFKREINWDKRLSFVVPHS